jgi:chromosome segregation ATPase
MNSLRNEVDSLNQEYNDLKSNKFYLPQAIEENKRKLERVREEFHEMEKKAENIDHQHANDFKNQEKDYQEQVKQLKLLLTEKTKEKKQKEEDYEEQKVKLQEEYSVCTFSFCSIVAN